MPASKHYDNDGKYRQIVENAHEAILVAQDNVFVYTNPKGESLFGYSAVELSASPLTDFIYEEDRAMVQDRHQRRLISDDLATVYPFRIINRSGEIKWVELKVERFEWEGRPATLCLFTDITNQKYVEQSLKKSEALYKLISENTEDVIFVLNMDLQYTYVSPSVKILRGFDSVEVMTHSIEQTLTPESLKTALQVFSEKLAEEMKIPFMSRPATSIELQMKHKNGSLIWTEVKATLLRDENGNPEGILGVTRDISARKKAESALLESEKRLKQILESTEDIIITQDLEGRYKYFNGPAIYGVTQAELLGKTPYDFFDSETATRMMENVRKVQATGNHSYIENCVEWMGKTLWFLDEINPVVDHAGKVVATTIFSRNITERKKIEVDLAASEKRFRQMADLLPGAVVEMDAEMNILYVNHHGLESFGYSQDDIDAGISGINLVHTDDREKAFKRFSAYFDGQYLPPTEYRIIKKNGEIFWVLFNATPIKNDSKIEGFHCILIDISRQKNSEREREKLIEELQEALAEVKTLSGLLPICSYCKKIRDDKGYWKELEQYIHDHSEAKFSHSICQECAKKHYPDLDIYDD